MIAFSQPIQKGDRIRADGKARSHQCCVQSAIATRISTAAFKAWWKIMNSVITRPSSLIGGIKLEKVDLLTLFKFTDELQFRMEELLERKKQID